MQGGLYKNSTFLDVTWREWLTEYPFILFINNKQNGLMTNFDKFCGAWARDCGDVPPSFSALLMTVIFRTVWRSAHDKFYDRFRQESNLDCEGDISYLTAEEMDNGSYSKHYDRFVYHISSTTGAYVTWWNEVVRRPHSDMKNKKHKSWRKFCFRSAHGAGPRFFCYVLFSG